MADRLPPLNALRAFEAAARELSFTKAGAELNLTAAAVGYQVRRLEMALGVELFYRLNRALALTDKGKSYVPVVQEAFSVLRKGTSDLSRRKSTDLLVVRTPWSFSSKWLVPRLDAFHKAHPHLTIKVDSTDEIVDFARDDVDVALQYSQKVERQLHSVLLFAEQVFPVCNPALAAGDRPLTEASQLIGHTLLHDAMTDVTWSDWLRATDAAAIDASTGTMFSHSALSIDAALAGDGIALGRSPLVANDLESGRLVRPFETALAGSWGYYMVCLPNREKEPKIKAFSDWVVKEARASEAATLMRVAW